MSIILPEGKELWEVLTGLFANDGEVAFFPATGSPISGSVRMSPPSQPWDAAGDVLARIRFRVRKGTGSYVVTLEHGEDDGVGGITVRGTVTETDTLPTTEQQFKTIDGMVPVSSYADNTEIIARVTVDVDAQAQVRIEPVDTRTPGNYSVVGEATIHEALAAEGDDTKLVRSPALNDGEKKLFVVEFDETVDFVNDSVVMRVRYKALAPGMTVHFRLLEEDDEGKLIERLSDFEAASETVKNWDITLAAAIIDQLEGTPFGELAFTGSSTAGGAQTVFLGETQHNQEWVAFGGAFNVVLGDSNDATGIRSPTTAIIDDTYIGTFAGIEKPAGGDNTNHVLSVRLRATSGTGEVRIKLTDVDKGAIFQKKINAPGSLSTVSWTLAEFQAADITDYKKLAFRVDKVGKGWELEVVEVKLTLPGAGSQGEFYELAALAPGFGGVDVSWVNMEADIPSGGILPGDNIKFYIGTPKRIYELKHPNFGWRDVSKGGVDYTEEGAKSWSACAWGDKVVFTNYVDPVQVLDLGDTEFEDLITSTDKPKFRCVATINAFLCGANVNPNSYVDGRPFSFWCSALGDPHYYHAADFAKKSFLFQIVATPGEITRLVGGEYGIILKENSVYRADVVGGDVVFQFEQLSAQAGTPFPRSVVVVGNDVYFWGIGALYRIAGGRALEDVALGTLKKAFFDSLFEELAMSSTISHDEKFNSSKVHGDYDPQSGLIVWSYQLRGDDPFRNRGLVTLDPRTGRIATGGGLAADSLTISGITPDLLGEPPSSELEGISGIPPELIGPPPSSSLPVPYDFHPEVVSTPIRNILPDVGPPEIRWIGSAGNRLSQDRELMRSLFVVAHPSQNEDQFGRFTAAGTYESMFLTNTVTSVDFDAEPGQSVFIDAVRPIYVLESGVAQQPDYAILMQAGELPNLDHKSTPLEGVRKSEGADRDEWVSFGDSAEGEFFKFALLFPALNSPYVREVTGLQIRYSIRGKQ